MKLRRAEGQEFMNPFRVFELLSCFSGGVFSFVSFDGFRLHGISLVIFFPLLIICRYYGMHGRLRNLCISWRQEGFGNRFHILDADFPSLQSLFLIILGLSFSVPLPRHAASYEKLVCAIKLQCHIRSWLHPPLPPFGSIQVIRVIFLHFHKRQTHFSLNRKHS